MNKRVPFNGQDKYPIENKLAALKSRVAATAALTVLAFGNLVAGNTNNYRPSTVADFGKAPVLRASVPSFAFHA